MENEFCDNTQEGVKTKKIEVEVEVEVENTLSPEPCALCP
jgi:hypothetical protein